MKFSKIYFKLISSFALILLFGTMVNIAAKPSIKKNPFGKTADGKAAEIYTLTNSKGTEAKITNYGAIVVSLGGQKRQV